MLNVTLATDGVAVASLVVAVVAIPVTWFVARHARQRPQVRYLVDFDVLVEPKADSNQALIGITFAGEQITRVSRTFVAFWNQRGDTLQSSDVVATDPLRVVVGDSDRILQARVVARSRHQTGFATTRAVDGASASIDFDFLDEGDGGILEILHQGTQAASVAGTVRGATMTSRGAGRLASSDIAWMSLPTRRARLRGRYRISRYAQGSRQQRVLLWISSLLPIVFFLTAVVVVLFIERYAGHGLVNPKSYNLETLHGQRAFASAVSKQQPKAIPGAFWVFMVLGTVLVVTSLFTRLFGRTSVPRSIVKKIDPNG